MSITVKNGNAQGNSESKKGQGHTIIGVRLRPPFQEKTSAALETDKDQSPEKSSGLRRSSLERLNSLRDSVNVQEEPPKPAFNCVRIKHPGTVVLIEPPTKEGQDDSPAKKHAKHRVFKCDHAIDSSDPGEPHYAHQKQVYDVVGAPLVENAMRGFNCCFLAYGQTGTGKTHTVVGEWSNEDQRGLLPRMSEDLFARIKELERSGAEVRTRISYLEIYNGQLRDLLVPPGIVSPAAGQKENQLTVHAHPKLGIYVENLTTPAVHNFEDVRELVTSGAKAQHIAATSMNLRSSRSHTVFSMKFEVNGNDATHRMASIQIVDLAGRENESTSETKGERLKELTYINRSLFQLANCVHALGRRSNEHIPFRNSKLTMILSESLRHNSLTTILAMLTPSASCYEENLSTCRFLESAGKIETEPEANCFGTQKLLLELRGEIDELTAPRPYSGPNAKKDRESQLRSKQALHAFVSHEWDMAVEQSVQLARAHRQGLLEALGVPTTLLEDTAMLERAKHAKMRLDAADEAIERLDAGVLAFQEALGVIDGKTDQMESVFREVQGMTPLPKAKRVHLAPWPEKLTVSLPPIKDAAPHQEALEAQQNSLPEKSRPNVSVTVSLPPIIFS